MLIYVQFFGFFFFTYRFGYASIEKQRQRLPVYKYRTALLYLVETHSTTIIVGETGSGKTTQIPQVIYFSFRHSVLLYVVSELAYNNSLLEFCSLLNFSVPFVGNNNNNCGSCFILIMWSIPFLEIMNKWTKKQYCSFWWKLNSIESKQSCNIWTA